MNIAKNMEAIFVATLLVLGGINMATAKAIRPAPVLSPGDTAGQASESIIPELPFVLVAANL